MLKYIKSNKELSIFNIIHYNKITKILKKNIRIICKDLNLMIYICLSEFYYMFRNLSIL